jgi:predicted O-methyltransferase YrrM
MVTSRFSHWTSTYLADRLKQVAYQLRHPDAPWIAAPMIELLEQLLQRTDRGLEWGSGRSTLWFARRVDGLISIEDNALWAGKVDSMLTAQGLRARVDLRLVPIEDGNRSAGSAYVTSATAIAPESLDFVLVDGDLRDHCATVAITRLKPGGLLIVDNIERYIPRKGPTRAPNARREEDGFASPEWRHWANDVSDWRSVWTTDGVSDTALWLKSCPGSQAAHQ